MTELKRNSLCSLCSLWLNSIVKVAIDIRRMTEFGVGTYIRNVVRTLARLDRESDYFLIGSQDRVGEMRGAAAELSWGAARWRRRYAERDS